MVSSVVAPDGEGGVGGLGDAALGASSMNAGLRRSLLTVSDLLPRSLTNFRLSDGQHGKDSYTERAEDGTRYRNVGRPNHSWPEK